MSSLVNLYKIPYIIYFKHVIILIGLVLINITNIYAANLYPPYRKTDDINPDQCLVAKNSAGPGDWIGYYYNACAEATGESTFYLPKIMVRRQTCNFIACWVQSKTLKWGGDCVIWPGGYAYPPDRYCARMAVSGNNGYTAGKYVDSRGVTQNDPVYTGSDGSIIALNLPKLCAYHDPSGAETFLADPIDINPYYGPYHRTDAPHPLAELVITCVANNLPIASAIKSFANITGANKLGDGFVTALTAILAPTEMLIKLFLNELKKLFKMNGIVYESLGCVNIPLAQGPDRYCAFLKPPVATPQIQTICQTLNDNTIQASTMANPCVSSPLVNNLIYNAIRVSYDQAIPLCLPQIAGSYDSTRDPYVNGNCVSIAYGSTIGTTTPSLVYKALNNLDVIKKCSASPPNNSELPCVQTLLANQSFRIAYGLQTSSTNGQRISNFASDMPDCNNPNYKAGEFCQAVWGVNTGSYGDIGLNFPATETTYNQAQLSSNVVISDPAGNSKTFVGTIVRKTNTTIATDQGNVSQQPNQICVYDMTATPTKLVGCANRTDGPPKPDVFTCDSSQSRMNCTSTYYQPKIVLQVASGGKSSQGVIAVPNVYTTASPTTINIAGFDYSSYVTDNNYVLMPFNNNAPPSKPGPDTKYGTYKPTTPPPFDSSNKRNNNNAVYLTGLEYLNGSYSLGGTQTCLTGFQMEDCSQNVQQCVLAQLANNNSVNCNTLQTYLNQDYSSVQIPGLQQCPSGATNCSVIDRLPYKNGQGSLPINKCTIGSTDIFCYNNSTALCTVTFAPSQRITPSYNGPGTEVLALNDYFTLSTGNSYDNTTQTIRDKTEIENGLCVPIPQPTCPTINATDGNTAANGYATWPQTSVGVKARGTCINSRDNVDKLVTRDCVISFANGSPQVQFDKLDGPRCLPTSISVTLNSASFPGNVNLSNATGLANTDAKGVTTITQQFTVTYKMADDNQDQLTVINDPGRDSSLNKGNIISLNINIPAGWTVNYIKKIDSKDAFNLWNAAIYMDTKSNMANFNIHNTIYPNPAPYIYAHSNYSDGQGVNNWRYTNNVTDTKYATGDNTMLIILDQPSLYDYNFYRFSNGGNRSINYNQNANIYGQTFSVTYEWSVSK